MSPYVNLLSLPVQAVANRQEPDSLVERRSAARIWMRRNNVEVLSDVNSNTVLVGRRQRKADRVPDDASGEAARPVAREPR
jgi:hypothetical protein